jgi:hypothetical protein
MKVLNALIALLVIFSAVQSMAADQVITLKTYEATDNNGYVFYSSQGSQNQIFQALELKYLYSTKLGSYPWDPNGSWHPFAIANGRNESAQDYIPLIQKNVMEIKQAAAAIDHGHEVQIKVDRDGNVLFNSKGELMMKIMPRASKKADPKYLEVLQKLAETQEQVASIQQQLADAQSYNGSALKSVATPDSNSAEEAKRATAAAAEAKERYED